MKKPIAILIGLSCMVVALAVVRITLVNSISTTGITLVEIQSQIADYEKENMLLQEKYLQAAAYTNIEKKATKLGFTSSNTALNLAAPLPLAKR